MLQFDGLKKSLIINNQLVSAKARAVVGKL